jgi:hypothetical protein
MVFRSKEFFHHLLSGSTVIIYRVYVDVEN